MFIKMGCKRWTRGTQLGLRIYTPSIRDLSNILNIPSRDQVWNSLNKFLNSLQEETTPAYSRNILIMDGNQQQDPIEATITIAKHGHTSQGYITAPQGTWLADFVVTNLNQNFNFEYNAGSTRDLLIVSDPTKDITAEREKQYQKIRRKVKSLNRKFHFIPPPNAAEIGLYWERKEIEFLKSQGFKPSHRHPYITSRIDFLRLKDISCDIDVLDEDDNFVKYVEVKAVARAPGESFNLTIKEWQSRETCRRNGCSYEIVVYYHVGEDILERRVITENETLINEPSGYWCTPA